MEQPCQVIALHHIGNYGGLGGSFFFAAHGSFDSSRVITTKLNTKNKPKLITMIQNYAWFCNMVILPYVVEVDAELFKETTKKLEEVTVRINSMQEAVIKSQEALLSCQETAISLQGSILSEKSKKIEDTVSSVHDIVSVFI